jgi:hypothetical protein
MLERIGIVRVWSIGSWGTYELESNAASFYTADGDVEEDARALWNLLVHVSSSRLLRA